MTNSCVNLTAYTKVLWEIRMVNLDTRSFALSLLIAAMLSSVTTAWAADTVAPAQPSVAERLASAREAIKSKDWRKSLAELTAAARTEPRNADVQNLLGYTYRVQTQPNLAKSFEHYNRALQLDPNHQATHNYIGMAYLMDKKPQEAQKHLEQVQRICGNTTCSDYTSLAQALEAFKKDGGAPVEKPIY